MGDLAVFDIFCYAAALVPHFDSVSSRAARSTALARNLLPSLRHIVVRKSLLAETGDDGI